MSDMDALADQYLHYILVEKGLAKKTITAYSRDIVRYLAYLKKEPHPRHRKSRYQDHSCTISSISKTRVWEPAPGPDTW